MVASSFVFLVPFLAFVGNADGKHLKVASVLAPPYLKATASTSDGGTGNATYEGYIVDLLNALVARMNYTYEFVIVEGYGKVVGGKWDGMIGAVVNDEADVAAGPLIATMEREKAVDFTYAFQKTEAAVVLLKRPDGMQPPLKTIDDFVVQDIVKYGIVKDTSMAEALRTDKGELQQKLWEGVMNSSMFLASNQQGLDKVRRDANFAFFMESSLAHAVVNKQPCDLQAIPAGFFKRQYALAVKNYSQLRDAFNQAIQSLYADGQIKSLEKKWFESDECKNSSTSWLKPQGSLLLIISALLVLFHSW